MFSFLKSKVPFFGLILAMISGVLLDFFYHNFYPYADLNTAAPGSSAAPAPAQVDNCDLLATRIKGFNYIQPLLFAEPSCESTRFSALKSELEQQINALKLSGELTTASIYLREFKMGKWMELNGEESYHPASLIKVPIMMAVLKMAENTPGLLEREFVFDNIPQEMVHTKQNYISDTIVRNKKYTVRELLRYMVTCSDNNAQYLLIKNLNPTGFDQMFTDLGLGMPMDKDSKQILLTAKAYSAFIKALFNATYLDPSKSEFALSLMDESKFKDGFVKGLPANTKLVHKFGEWDDKKTFELHESGLVYLKDKVYLLTVMTRSDRREKLPPAIAALVRTLYNQLEQLP